MTTLLFTLIYIVTITTLTLQETKHITFPTVELAREIDIPGGFFERIESLLITG